MHFTVFFAPVSFPRCRTDEITQQFSTSAKIRTPCFISHHSRNCNLILLHLFSLIHQQSFAPKKKNPTSYWRFECFNVSLLAFHTKESDTKEFRCTAIKALPFIRLLMRSSDACFLRTVTLRYVHRSHHNVCVCLLLLFL